VTDILTISDVSVNFDGFIAIDCLSMCLSPNELRVVIGPNGSGKTTLLDMLCGKTVPTSGSILFNGHELTDMEDYQISRVGVGRKFQSPSIYQNLTVSENLGLSSSADRGVWGTLFRPNSRDVNLQIEAVAEQIFLKEQLQKKAGILSHGQKQWLEIGKLIMQDSELMLLDEPVAGMSPKECELTAALLKEISLGRTLIVVEHDMDFVNLISQTVTVLDQGRILIEGTLDSVRKNRQVIEVYLGE
jgi:urea transport system ATP-binding protein|tara:strand:- start:4476 stop:5210 length:735 start_codon:yes stop_codon:yes gene_type:complete